MNITKRGNMAVNILKPQQIGGIITASPIWLAPLAGVTTPSFRLFHKKLGAGLVHTEMVSALGLIYGGSRTREYLKIQHSERPVVLQLFAATAEALERGTQIALDSVNYEGIQVNMACPMPKVTKKGSGAKMLDNPQEAAVTVRRLKRFGLPVWIKMRLLPQNSPLKTENFCENLIEAGTDLIILHGRTPAQRYEGLANKSEVCRISRLFPNMIVGSGDYYHPKDAIEYLNGGCTAVIAARGVLKDIYLIPKTLSAIGYTISSSYLNTNLREKIDSLIDLGDNAVSLEGERLVLVLIRRMLPGVLKGFQGAPILRQETALIRNWEEMREAFINFKKTLNDIKS